MMERQPNGNVLAEPEGFFLGILKRLTGATGATGASGTHRPIPSLAVCISGAVRTFPSACFRQSFDRFRLAMPPFDVFLVLKLDDAAYDSMLNDEFGVQAFMASIRTIRPRRVVLFHRFEDPKVNHSSYSSQLTMIDLSFRIAEAHRKYDYYMRYRPDFIMIDPIPISDMNVFKRDTIYTTRKHDAPASDQIFLISAVTKRYWWDMQPKIGLTALCSPEYLIFRNQVVQNGPHFRGGLLRPWSGDLLTWDEDDARLRTVLKSKMPRCMQQNRAPPSHSGNLAETIGRLTRALHEASVAADGFRFDYRYELAGGETKHHWWFHWW